MKSLKSLAKYKSFSPGEINHLQLGSKTSEGKQKRFNLAISARANFAFIPSLEARNPLCLKTNNKLSRRVKSLTGSSEFPTGRKLLSMFQILLPLLGWRGVSSSTHRWLLVNRDTVRKNSCDLIPKSWGERQLGILLSPFSFSSVEVGASGRWVNGRGLIYRLIHFEKHGRMGDRVQKAG